MENKNNAYAHMMQVFRNSWTYNKLTDTEKLRFDNAFDSKIVLGSLRGNYHTRCEQMNALYDVFLHAIGYNGPSWRCDDSEVIPFW